MSSIPVKLSSADIKRRAVQILQPLGVTIEKDMVKYGMRTLWRCEVEGVVVWARWQGSKRRAAVVELRLKVRKGWRGGGGRREVVEARGWCEWDGRWMECWGEETICGHERKRCPGVWVAREINKRVVEMERRGD